MTARPVTAVGVVAHHHNPRAAELVREAMVWLAGRGVDVRVLDHDAAALGLEHPGRPADEVGACDVVLAVGGDGTMLRAVDLFAPVPVLGVNAGLLGYLTAVEGNAMIEALGGVLAGRHAVEERMMLAATLHRVGEPPTRVTALNELVVEKAVAGHTVRLQVSIGAAPFTTYAADGLIVATPTGSTAYALSAGGPIVSPRHRALLLTPVAPHMLFDRTLVLDPDDTVTLEVVGHRSAATSADGRPLGPLSPGDSVVCGAAAQPARFVSFGGRDFHHILKQKFGLADR